ncbi:hypothetical protein LTR78_001769 [Recurvomyces mirabilis]|uniref:Uncharacterized protein n=1 Tax=Recurvomyces mirabilis TaxID=574656 RepID=A0AAE0WV26_9PEZI|nr:hypothetical protein LTR78_001769 [Recurvomyces mirabilis]KAK5156791.1 hypothetical protein LTS14_005004 [Recurvomyces mirabilis]
MSTQMSEKRGQDEHYDGDLRKTDTAGSVVLTMEMFEKLYLSPANKVSGDLRQRFANPTPLPLLGFIVTTACVPSALMGWGGASGGGAATIGVCYFFGGMLQIIGAVLEWIIGNTFVYIVFGTFGAFWLSFAATLTPYYNAETAFTSTAKSEAAGAAAFETSFAFFPAFLGVIVFMFMICSLRTNVIFFLIFLTVDIALFLLAAAYWKASVGELALFHTLGFTAGAFTFILCVLALYLLFVQLLAAVEFPLTLPVGDLSSRIGKKKVGPGEAV